MKEKDTSQPITDLNELVKREVHREVNLYIEESNSRHDKTHEAVVRVEELVRKTSGGACAKVHNVVQDVVLFVIAFFTFR